MCLDSINIQFCSNVCDIGPLTILLAIIKTREKVLMRFFKFLNNFKRHIIANLQYKSIVNKSGIQAKFLIPSVAVKYILNFTFQIEDISFRFLHFITKASSI